MGTRDSYRFTLQWGSDTADKVQAGDALKSMGSRKSRLIVAAVAEYVRRYPESLSPGHSFKAATEPPLTRGQVEGIVREMIDARLANTAYDAAGSGSVNPDSPSEDDIDFMVQNLDMFTAN